MADEDGELGFEEDDTIFVVSKEHEDADFRYGICKGGAIGFFQNDYVKDEKPYGAGGAAAAPPLSDRERAEKTAKAAGFSVVAVVTAEYDNVADEDGELGFEEEDKIYNTKKFLLDS